MQEGQGQVLRELRELKEGHERQDEKGDPVLPDLDQQAAVEQVQEQGGLGQEE